MTQSAFETIIGMLEAGNVPYVLHEHPAVTTIDEARELVPELVENLVKTVAFELKGDGWVLVATPCDTRVEYKALARALGCKRTDLRLMPAAEVEAELGFEIGGVGPFPVSDRVRVVLDARLSGRSVVRCGCGLRTRSVELAREDLVRVSNALGA